LTAGAVSSITSSQVTTALGYTPVQGNGTGASGTWGIGITGNAATATVASGLTGTPNISVGTIKTTGSLVVNGTTSPGYQLCSYISSGNNGFTAATGTNTSSDYAAYDFWQGGSQQAVLYTNQGNFYCATISGSAVFQTGGTARLTLNSSGAQITSLGVGTAPSGTAGVVSATSFSGAGTGLTGTAASLSIGGNAATATSVSSITSSQVTTALGFTPYNATNPNSYTNNVLTAGAGISVSASTGASTIANTGVTSIVAGSGISISGATGAVTVSASGGAATTLTTTATTAASTFYPAFAPANGGSGQTIYNSAGLTFVPSTGALTATLISGSSDERLKEDWVDLPSTFLDDLAEVKHGQYTRTSTGNKEVGVSAQSLQKVLAQAVLEDEDGMLSVAYGNAALVAAIELAKEVKELRKEIAALKAR
jgi:hypothetical protein